MKKGYICESCNSFHTNDEYIFECRTCDNDACNYCANEQLCEKCFNKYKKGVLGYHKHGYDDEYKTIWKVNHTKQ